MQYPNCQTTCRAGKVRNMLVYKNIGYYSDDCARTRFSDLKSFIFHGKTIINSFPVVQVISNRQIVTNRDRKIP
jgi:hypothetical protein